MNVFRILILCLFSFGLISCKKEIKRSDNFVDRAWSIKLSSKSLEGSKPDPEIQAASTLTLMSDNKLYYDIYFISEVDNADLGAAVLMIDPNQKLDLKIGAFQKNSSKGFLVSSDEQRESMLTKKMSLTVFSKQYPQGIVQGDL